MIRNRICVLTSVWLFLALQSLLMTGAFADDVIPPCMDHGQKLSIDNSQVLTWKTTTANQFLARAYVEGKVTHVTLDRQTHYQFEIQIGTGLNDTLEVIYNKDAGAYPVAVPGMDVQACGDYITSTQQAGGYPASPSGAIIHWVHQNTRGGTHDSGFMVMGGALIGFNPADVAGNSQNSYMTFFNSLNGIGSQDETKLGASQ